MSSNKILNINTISKINFRKINSDLEKGHSPESFAIELVIIIGFLWTYPFFFPKALRDQTSDDYYSKQHTLVQSPSHQLLSKQNAGSEPSTPTRLQNKDLKIDSPSSNLIRQTKLQEIIQSHKSSLKSLQKEKLRKRRSDSGVTTANLTNLSVNQEHLSPKSVTLVNLSSKDDGTN